MDVAIENYNVEANAIVEQSHRQQSKRDIRQTSPTDSNAPPRKKADQMETMGPITAARSIDVGETGLGRAENEDTDTDDSGPDPAKDDVDGWLVKFRKQSKRHKKLIAALDLMATTAKDPSCNIPLLSGAVFRNWSYRVRLFLNPLEMEGHQAKLGEFLGIFTKVVDAVSILQVACTVWCPDIDLRATAICE
ncbi:hypothetical protein RP20_CCG002279 [Aedes albopictus]|nr:hypothetical protein RP20_CCG002279 [Aedes albopictus]